MKKLAVWSIQRVVCYRVALNHDLLVGEDEILQDGAEPLRRRPD